MRKVALILICLVLLMSCSKDNNSQIAEKFNLVNVSGGFAGVDENFDKGQIIWTFNEQNSTLIVEKNTNAVFSGLDEGTYSYFIQTINNGRFIHIDNTERGGITNSENRMVIDENIVSNGSGADGFILRFEK